VSLDRLQDFGSNSLQRALRGLHTSLNRGLEKPIKKPFGVFRLGSITIGMVSKS